MLRDVAGTVIYVGATIDMRSRMRTHATAAWWPDVDQSAISFEGLPDERAAAQVERTLIRLHKPRHNKAGIVGAYIPYRSVRHRPKRTDRASALTSEMEDLAAAWRRRPDLIDRARGEGLTWQEIATALRMTPQGVRKLHATQWGSDMHG